MNQQLIQVINQLKSIRNPQQMAMFKGFYRNSEEHSLL